MYPRKMTMVAPIIIAAAITAAASMANERQNASAAGSATSQGRQFSVDMANKQRAWELDDRSEGREYMEDTLWGREDTAVQRRVADAQSAGIHPLFALGASGGGGTGGGGGQSRNITIPGYPASGSYAGDGLAKLGQIAGDTINKLESSKAEAEQLRMQKETHRLRSMKLKGEIEMDNTVLMNLQSKIKRGEGVANTEPGSIPMDTPQRSIGTEVLRGPYGGYYEIPPGMTPTQSWEDFGGEVSDWTIGPGNMARIYQYRRDRLNRHKNQIQAVKRHRSTRRNLKRSKQSRWNKWFGD